MYRTQSSCSILRKEKDTKEEGRNGSKLYPKAEFPEGKKRDFQNVLMPEPTVFATLIAKFASFSRRRKKDEHDRIWLC